MYGIEVTTSELGWLELFFKECRNNKSYDQTSQKNVWLAVLKDNILKRMIFEFTGPQIKCRKWLRGGEATAAM